MKSPILICLFNIAIWGQLAGASDCNFDPGALVQYEQSVLKAAETRNVKALATNFACLIQAQSESAGASRYLASSFLRPILGGQQIKSLPNDSRYKIVAQYLEEIATRSPQGVQQSFLSEFAKGDWKFYVLFCEQGNVEFCERFMPDEQAIKDGPPVIAAASMLRLKKAYMVLKGKQRDLVAQRLMSLYKEIPATEKLKRRLINEIYDELFQRQIPLSQLG